MLWWDNEVHLPVLIFQPKSCAYCKLNSAFIGSKCQRCSNSQKKYGAPLLCGKCGSKSAYNNEKAKVSNRVVKSHYAV